MKIEFYLNPNDFYNFMNGEWVTMNKNNLLKLIADPTEVEFDANRVRKYHVRPQWKKPSGDANIGASVIKNPYL